MALFRRKRVDFDPRTVKDTSETCIISSIDGISRMIPATIQTRHHIRPMVDEYCLRTWHVVDLHEGFRIPEEVQGIEFLVRLRTLHEEMELWVYKATDGTLIEESCSHQYFPKKHRKPLPKPRKVNKRKMVIN